MLSGRSVFAIVFFVLLGGFIWSFMAYREAKEQVNLLSSSQGQAQVAQWEVDALLAKVGGLILLPEDEKPAVATIQDIEALVQAEAFYQGAKNGDKVIVYRHKAIIYDPVNNKLVNVGPVYLQNEPVSPVVEPVQEEVFEPEAVVAEETPHEDHEDEEVVDDEEQ